MEKRSQDRGPIKPGEITERSHQIGWNQLSRRSGEALVNRVGLFRRLVDFRPQGRLIEVTESARFPLGLRHAKIMVGHSSRLIVILDNRTKSQAPLGRGSLVVIRSITERGRKTLALALLSSLIPLGCGVETSSPVNSPIKPVGNRIVLVTNGNSDWWSAVEKGMKDAGTRFSADVEMKRNGEGAGTEGQIRLLEEALSASDVKGVAVSAYDGEAPGIADAMRKLKDDGKLVITIDSDVSPSAAETRRFYIGTDNRKAGEIAGKVTATLRPEGGTVAVFVGNLSAANARARLDGFYEGAGSKFIKPPVEVFEDQHDMNKAQSLPQVAITKHPDLGVMLGLYSYNAPRIADEVSKAPPDFRKKTTIVTFDLDEQAVDHLEKSNIDVSVCQNPYEIGFQAVRLLSALAKDEKGTVEEMFPKGVTTLDTGVRIIVPTDVSPVKGKEVKTIKEMKEWLSSKGLKSS